MKTRPDQRLGRQFNLFRGDLKGGPKHAVCFMPGTKERVDSRPLVAKKSRERYCVFNKTRESFLSFSVTAADTHLARLRGLLGRLRLKSDEGIWVIPSQGIHTIGMLFSIDLIYLDSANRVIHLSESFGSFRIGPIRTKCSSVLELPTRTIYASQTQVGDELLICSAEEMEEHLTRKQTKIDYKTA